MPEPATSLPVKRPEVVSWSSGNKGQYLVRNRRTGEAFQLGEQEHFLLAHLDGRHSAEQVCEAFRQQFAEPFCAAELEQFLKLAGEQGLLLSADDPLGRPLDKQIPGRSANAPDEHHVEQPASDRCHGVFAPRGGVAKRALGKASAKGIIGQILAAAAAAMQWVAARLNQAAANIHVIRLMHFDFVPRPDDVFIVTYPRSGTTWMQMILYQLTTEGSMEIPHISEYCPWFERSLRSGRGFETRPSPRIFKSHLPYGRIPKGPCKYIYVARDGKDVAVSYYHLCRAYTGLEEPFDEFFERYLRGKVESGSWFEHVKGWWRHRHDPNVLFLTYEELTQDLDGCIHRIADFCGFEVPSDRFPEIVERCRFRYMKEHETRFDPAMETLWEQGVQVNSFIRKGKVGDGAVRLTSEQRSRFDAIRRRRWSPAGLTWPPTNGAPNGMRLPDNDPAPPPHAYAPSMLDQATDPRP
jgi:hypothetical protein